LGWHDRNLTFAYLLQAGNPQAFCGSFRVCHVDAVGNCKYVGEDGFELLTS